jgi:tRNA(Ile2) C34 agmatinyltransferase TiaS
MKKSIDSLVKLWEFNGFRKLKPKKEKLVRSKKVKQSKEEILIIPERLQELSKQCEFCGSFEEIEIIESQYLCKHCFTKLGTSQPVEVKREVVVYA